MAGNGNNSLKDKTLWVHPMTRSGARLLAATFRSIGMNAQVLPESDQRTLELGNRWSSGEECLPEKVTLGDYLKVTELDDFDPANTVFLMPTANGPCRFGQYAHLMRNVLDKLGLEEVTILSPSSKNGYGDLDGADISFFRSAWLGLIAADVLRKMLLKTRPYECTPGDTDRVYEQALTAAERVLENQGSNYRTRLYSLRDALVQARDNFRAVDAEYTTDKPLLGILGEIFCRHNRFANENMIRALEAHGAETWIADVGEWVFYTDWSRMDNMTRQGRKFSPAMLMAKVKEKFMKHDEHILLAPFHDDFIGHEEPESTELIVRHGEPYLPAWGALGEMAVSIGRAGYLHAKGVDGIVDISPFSCMNGIVTEAVYPSFSRDHDNIPCRVFYYDGTATDIDRDIGIFMELVRGYRGRKTIQRRYPPVFGVHT